MDHVNGIVRELSPATTAIAMDPTNPALVLQRVDDAFVAAHSVHVRIAHRGHDDGDPVVVDVEVKRVRTAPPSPSPPTPPKRGLTSLCPCPQESYKKWKGEHQGLDVEIDLDCGQKPFAFYYDGQLCGKAVHLCTASWDMEADSPIAKIHCVSPAYDARTFARIPEWHCTRHSSSPLAEPRSSSS